MGMKKELSPKALLSRIKEARDALRGALLPTPLRRSEALSEELGLEIYFKPENFQRTGSFKARGASFKLKRLGSRERAWGVVAASAGNHAQGVALAARGTRTKCLIVMPQGAPMTKVQKVRELGAEVELFGGGYEESFGRARTLERERGLKLIPAFDDPDIIAGQGTMGLELLEELPELDCAVIPTGGGGLISGCAVALKEKRPAVEVIGVVAAEAPALARSLEAGKLLSHPAGSTIADGIAVSRPGELTFPLIRRYVDQVVEVAEDEIAAAILRLLEDEKVLVEGAGATALAAVLERKFRIRGTKVVVVLSGGNIDVNVISRIIGRGLARAGRYVRLGVSLADEPGSLARLTSIVGEARGNILHIEHDRMSTSVPISATLVSLHIEVRGADHLHDILSRLRRAGYDVHTSPYGNLGP